MKSLAKRFVLFLLVCFCLPASCATTKMTDAWRDDTYRGTIRKVVVIGIFKEPDTRKMFEDEFAYRLKARGVDATASHKIFSAAELPDKDVVIANIRELGADGVLVTRVMDTETVKTHVPDKPMSCRRITVTTVRITVTATDQGTRKRRGMHIRRRTCTTSAMRN